MNDINIWDKINNAPIESPKTYSIEFLCGYFGVENKYTSAPNRSISISELNEHLPLDFMRKINKDGQNLYYAVYPVTEGGTWYVTFAIPIQEQSQVSALVYKCVYVDPALFSSIECLSEITPGQSTLENVQLCAPMTDTITIASSGIFSYSLIDENTVALVKYERNTHTLNDMIVSSIDFIPRNKAACIYGYSLCDDILYSQQGTR
ncbi:MAG: hypothetical protein IJB17_01855 [Oscillospiraceae bacterium]|nr:hypothetical protein [Oscillospiraceae bacterium]